MPPLPFNGHNITYSEKSRNNNQPLIKNDIDINYNFTIYISILLISLIYIITSLILFILSKKSKLMIIRDINIYIYNTISVIFLLTLLLVEASLNDTKKTGKYNNKKINNFVYVIVCAYCIPIWIFTNIVRVKKMEFRLKIQNARLNNSLYKIGNNKEHKNKLHINVIQFQLYEKWSNVAVLILLGIITLILTLLYTINKDILLNGKYSTDNCHTAILITIFISMFYASYKKYKIRRYEETIGVQNEINTTIIFSLICSLGYIIFRCLSVKFRYIPSSIWLALFFIIYHTIIVVRPVFAVRHYQNKVEMLYKKYKRHSISNNKVSNEINEMEISTFEEVLNPNTSKYEEFKRFLVGEVCIENLLFYETMINLLLKCQLNELTTDSWNLTQFIESSEKDPNHKIINITSSETNEIPISNDDEIPYYEKLYKAIVIKESPEIRKQLIHIYDEFIPEGSEYQLNLTSDLVNLIGQKINEGKNIDVILFKPVLKEVYELLRWTNYPRFLQTRTEN